MITPGCVGLSAKRTGFYPKAVRFFTQSNYSHVFVIAHDYYNKQQVFEVNLEAGLRGFESEYIQKNNDSYEIYKPIKATDKEIYKAVSETFHYCNGVTYGFLQIPWFAFRAIFRVFGIELHRNWFPWGGICSEMPLIYLKLINKEYAQAFAHLTENECSPQDIAAVVESRTDLFQFITERK